MTDPNSIFKKGYYRTDTPSDGFNDEERRMAQRLLKGDNLDRLRAANRTGRRFRPAPVSVSYAYWWWSGGDAAFLACWKMERIENGKRFEHHYTGDIEDEINRLKAAGFTVREIKIDGAPSLLQSSRGPCAKRKSFSERFKNFAMVKP